MNWQPIKKLIPSPVKGAVKGALTARRLSRALAAVAALPPGQIPDTRLLIELQMGWDNEGMAADTDFLAEVARQALATDGPVLECGSGLTTLLLGLLAGRRGVETWSLEHFPEWRERVGGEVASHHVPRVRVCHAPLRDYGEFSWYDPPLAEMPAQFRLVVCDGPPGDTPGGRYGLWPVMRARLPSGSLILLDDVERASEAEALRRWAAEGRMETSISETSRGMFALARVG
jgi:hypothetical protein